MLSSCALSTLVLAAGPALAAEPDAGAEPGSGLSAAQTLLIFVGIPVGLFALISLLVMVPAIARGGYKPSLGWWSEPVWFGGPSEPYEALERADSTTGSGGTSVGGGGSARW